MIRILVTSGDRNRHYDSASFVHTIFRDLDPFSVRVWRGAGSRATTRLLCSSASGCPTGGAGIYYHRGHCSYSGLEKSHLHSTGWLVLSTLFGIPLGLWFLTSSHQRGVKVMLALIIMAFSVYSLTGKTAMELRSDSRGWLLVCGFCAGVLGGAYGMNGPPLAIYGAMRRWSAQHFRATLQAYFLPASIIGMGGYWVAGLWVPSVTHYYLLSLPVTLPAIFLGRVINHRLRGDAFLKYIYLGLASIGALLLVQAITGRL